MKSILKIGVLVTLASLGFLTIKADASVGTEGIDSQVWEKPFNEISQVACHNCYERQYWDQNFSTVLNEVKTVELDFWDLSNDTGLFAEKTPGYWYVRHNGHTKNHNNCSAGAGLDLEGCLKRVKVWSDNHPGHFPITIILDKKQGWSKSSSRRTPTDLDAMLSTTLGDKIYTPNDLKQFGVAKLRSRESPLASVATNSNLRVVVQFAGWPTAEELKGKIILILNAAWNEDLEKYIRDTTSSTRKVFVGPATDARGDIKLRPSGMSNSASAEVVVQNISSLQLGGSLETLVCLSKRRNKLTRVWSEEDKSFRELHRIGVNLAAYKDFKRQRAWKNGYIFPSTKKCSARPRTL